MQAETRRSIDRRLARIEGQIRGLRRMLDENAYCVDVLTQMSAVKSALNQTASLIAAEHIHCCVLNHGSASAHPKANEQPLEALVEELDEVLKQLVR